MEQLLFCYVTEVDLLLLVDWELSFEFDIEFHKLLDFSFEVEVFCVKLFAILGKIALFISNLVAPELVWAIILVCILALLFNIFSHDVIAF